MNPYTLVDFITREDELQKVSTMTPDEIIDHMYKNFRGYHPSKGADDRELDLMKEHADIVHRADNHLLIGRHDCFFALYIV